MAFKRLIKHNPDFMSDEELEEAFVVRTAELHILSDLVRANQGEVNQHALVIGPRGMGKTMLMNRLALLVRSDAALSETWYPIVAPEEIYDAATEGEIWLAILKSLADQQRREKGEFERWNTRHEALMRELDEGRLRAQTLGALTEFSHEQGKRLLVLIENLQMLIGEQFAKDADWDLRKTLLNRPEIMLVLTTTSRFKKIRDPAFAAYELFRELELKPLSTDNCRRLWHKVSGQDLKNQKIRPMEILTGGNPRLLAILATFAPERPLQELLTNLAELIDDHTPFLKSNIDALPPQERRVFVTLAKLWEPATARQVGDRCRLDSNTASAVLISLVNRGAVVERGKRGRGKLYQVAERIYCIYYLMRLSGSESDRMRAFVRFMVPLYGEDGLARSLAVAACGTGASDRFLFIEGYRQLLAEDVPQGVRKKILEATPKAFLELPEVQEILKNEGHPAKSIHRHKGRTNAARNLEKDLLALLLEGELEEAATAASGIVERYADSKDTELQMSVARALIGKGVALGLLDRYEEAHEAIEAYDEVIRRFADAETPGLRTSVSWALNGKAWIFYSTGKGRLDEAIATAERAVDLASEELAFRHTLASVYGLASRWDDAFEQMGLFLDEEQFVKDHLEDILTLLTDAAADGQAGHALTALSGTVVEQAMEPLVAALKDLAGQPHEGPQEVDEVKKDVLARIEARREALADLRARFEDS